VTYEVEEAPHVNEPKTESKSATHNKPSNNAQAEGSDAKVGTSGSTGEEPASKESESEEAHKSSGGATSNGGGKNPPTGGGSEGGNNPSRSGGAKSNDGIANGKPVAMSTQSHSGGSSSPVVPILIAIAVLAAISIGVVLYRQRRSDAGSGPDGRVSSPNAS